MHGPPCRSPLLLGTLCFLRIWLDCTRCLLNTSGYCLSALSSAPLELLIGAGGGFHSVPILLLIYPQEKTELITAISLAVVFFNATSGPLAYARMKRVDYKSGIVFAIATIPGAILGASPQRTFPGYFRCDIWRLDDHRRDLPLVLNQEHHSRPEHHDHLAKRSKVWRILDERRLTDADGTTYHYAFNPSCRGRVEYFCWFCFEFARSGRRFYPRTCARQSAGFPRPYCHRNLPFCARHHGAAGLLPTSRRGSSSMGVRRTLLLGIGVVVGAQFGALLSKRVGGKLIIRGSAVALVFVGIRLIVGQL